MSSCTRDGHERMKRTSEWDRLPSVGTLPAFEDLPEHQLKNCPRCKSTLARETKPQGEI